MFESALVYAGLLVMLAGGVSLVKPLRFLRIARRAQGALVLAAGLVIVLVGWAIPAREVRIQEARTQLDLFMPAYQFNEVHSIQILASKERVNDAIKSVTADEIALFRTLTWIRRLGRRTPEGVLNAPEKKPLLEVMLKSDFVLLSEQPGREIVLGNAIIASPGSRPKNQVTPEVFKAAHAPGLVLATINFFVEDADAHGCTLSTETRVYATDLESQRRFARYWRVIYPGSALLRRTWLRAIKRRAETAQ